MDSLKDVEIAIVVRYNRFRAVTLSDEHLSFRVGWTDLGAERPSCDEASFPSAPLPSSYLTK